MLLPELRPLLEGGMPIKGDAIVLVNEQPIGRPVVFVVGKETRIEGGDDGTYIVTPSLTPDGDLKYAIRLMNSGPDGSLGAEKKALTMITYPWGSFNFGSSDDGTTLGFAADMIGP